MASFHADDWKRAIGTLAPTIASAFGTPLLGAAVGALSEAILGRPDGSQAEISQVLLRGQLTPEAAAEVQKAEIAFRTRMRELDIDLERMQLDQDRAYLADVQDARKRQVATGDHWPQAILVVAFAIYVLEFCFFVFVGMPADEFTRALITRAFGTIDGVLITAVGYFIGSSRGSKQSGDAVRRIAESQQPQQPQVVVQQPQATTANVTPIASPLPGQAEAP